MPFISICVPTYKHPEYVERLLKSVAIQTFRDFEVVISDNSPDEAVEQMVKKFEGQFPLRYYRNTPACNMAENHNRATERGTGEWIKMMHDDDWFATADALERFAETARKTSKKLIFSACHNVYSPSQRHEKEELVGWKKEMLEDSHLNLFYLNVIGHPSTVMHHKDDSIKYDNRFNWVVDIDYYISYMTKYPGFEYIPEPLVNIANNDINESNKYYKNPRVEVPEYLTMLSKYPPDLALQYPYVFHLVWNLVKRFKIKKLDDIKHFGYHGALPDKIEEVIHFQKKIPRIILKQTPYSKWFMDKLWNKLKQ